MSSQKTIEIIQERDESGLDKDGSGDKCNHLNVLGTFKKLSQ